ncbi:MAG: GMC family oxidoreductase [Nevskiales bacterium]
MFGRFFTHECDFDYVIVGAGSAGCVLANRLSADPNTRVLLIEAGGDDQHWSVRIPVGYLLLVKDQQRNWQFNTEPQAHLNNRRLFWPRGRMLGGTSSMNGMVYIRGQHEDYDGWRDLGNPGWAYEDVLPLFKANEDNERGAGAHHGAGGGLAVGETRGYSSLPQYFLDACQQAGYADNPDFNGAQQSGAGRYQQTIRNGERCSAAAGFLHPVLDRPNLFIQLGAHATRLTFDGRRVTGVAYQMRGVMRQAHAAREVILCGGVVQSPQLLLLSGIGPRAELERHGIACRQHLPGVGENLQDHIDLIVSHHDRSRQALHFGPSALPAHVRAWWSFWRTRRGPLVSALEVGAFAALTPGATRPDAQFHFVSGLILDHGRQLPYRPGVSLHVCVLRPRSRGSIRLQSADPLAAPIIQPNYLSAPEDLELLKRCVHEARRLFAQRAFKSVLGAEEQPGAAAQSEAEIEAFIRAKSESVYHPVGSCKMGRDDLAVVDAELKVHGLEGLRIADASIMPTLISGNTNATSIMIGEKCARMVLAAREPQQLMEQAAA